MSGFEIDISSNLKDVEKQLHSFEKKAIKTAAARALNKTGTSVRAEAARRIKSQTGLTVKRIKQRLAIQKATKSSLVLVITGLRATTNIIEWVTGPKTKVGSFRKQAGVTSKAWKRSKVYPGTFIGRGRGSRKLLVFKRDASKSSGVSAVHGPSIRRSFHKEINALKPFAQKRFQKVFEHEINFEINKLLHK